jgi:flavodoxin
MKKLLVLVIAFMIFGRSMEAQNQARREKVLIAYFSWSGNTRTVARFIHEKTGGELFEIVTVDPYPTDFNACVTQAERELKELHRPPLATKVNNLDSYDVIFLGYPSWFYTIPRAVAVFLESYNFRGKTIIPFSTHEGGGLSNSIRDINKLCPNSTLLEAIVIRGTQAGRSQADVDRWLRKIGMI